MPSLEKTIKETIARVVRKETAALRAEIVGLRKTVRALSKDHADYCKLDGASWDSQYEFNENIVDALSDAWRTLEEKGIVEPIAVVEEEAPKTSKASGKKEGKAQTLTPEDFQNIREQTGLTQVQFAEFLGVNTHNYHLWENGKAYPRKSNIEKILEVKAMGKREFKRLCKEKNIDLKKTSKKGAEKND